MNSIKYKKKKIKMMSRIYYFYNELSLNAIHWLEQNYKLYKGRFYTNLQQKGLGWSFPLCHQMILQSKIDSFSLVHEQTTAIQEEISFKKGSFLYDIPYEWKQTFGRYFHSV